MADWDDGEVGIAIAVAVAVGTGVGAGVSRPGLAG